MALQKTIMSRAGFEISYWKITDWKILMSQSIMDITLTPYVSSTTRADGLEPVNEEIRKIRVLDRINKAAPEKNLTDYTDYFSPLALETSDLDIYKMMYNYIIEKVPEFAGATSI